MAHYLIPIRFRFLRVPLTWTASTDARGATILHGQIQGRGIRPDALKVDERDPWQFRDTFFDLAENAESLAAFLEEVGVWSSDPDAASLDWSRYPLTVRPEGVWQFRKDLKDALLHQKSFAASVAPQLEKPKSLLDLYTANSINSFPLRFELSDVAAGVVTFTNARQMLFATVLADVARGLRFKVCKRKDCQKPFAIESEHKRDYCEPYCGHLESVRRKRAKARKSKRGRKSLRKKLNTP